MKKLNVIYFALALTFSLSSVAAMRCDQMFVKESITEKMLKDVDYSKSELNIRIQELIAKYPDHVALVENVAIQNMESYHNWNTGRLVKRVSDIGLSGTNNILVVSIKNLEGQSLDQFKNDYINAITFNTVSFPLSSDAGHLYTRFGGKTYDFMGTVSASDYYISESRLEPVILLTNKEFHNFSNYIQSVQKNKNNLGNFEYAGVIQVDKSNVFTNKAGRANGHNCTSWIVTARIGENGETLKEIAGARAHQDIGTNPGWWSNYLNTVANRDRVPFSVYFTGEKDLKATIKSIKKKSGAKLEWNFGVH